MLSRYEADRHFPPQAPALLFGAEDQQRAYDLYGSNCGPGAIAGICGTTPEHVVGMLGEKFQKIRGTTEIMLRATLDQLGVRWEDVPAGWPDYGIARVQWGGPWLYSDDPFEKLRHSHWIGVATRGLPNVMIFDINAIGVGGWISLAEWDDLVIPWLLEACEPEATGEWWISETLKIHPSSVSK